MAAPGMAPMGYGHPQQSYPMAAHPQMYAAQQQYGRGGYPPQPAMNYNAMPQQGKQEDRDAYEIFTRAKFHSQQLSS